MAIMSIFDTEGRPMEDYEIPDDILDAANKVASFMKNNDVAKLCGLELDDQH